MRGKGIILPKKEDIRKAKNAERRFKTLKANNTKWELEQEKMKKLQEEYIKNGNNNAWCKEYPSYY